MTDYAVIYEPAGDGSWSARTVDLPVFVAGDSREEAKQEVRAAIATYLDVLREDGEEAPVPRSVAGSVSVTHPGTQVT